MSSSKANSKFLGHSWFIDETLAVWVQKPLEEGKRISSAKIGVLASSGASNVAAIGSYTQDKGQAVFILPYIGLDDTVVSSVVLDVGGAIQDRMMVGLKPYAGRVAERNKWAGKCSVCCVCVCVCGSTEGSVGEREDGLEVYHIKNRTSENTKMLVFSAFCTAHTKNACLERHTRRTSLEHCTRTEQNLHNSNIDCTQLLSKNFF